MWFVLMCLGGVESNGAQGTRAVSPLHPIDWNRGRLRRLTLVYCLGSTERLHWRISMRCFHRLLLSVLTATTVTMSAQCPRSEQVPKWNADRARFTCVAPVSSRGPATEEVVLPTGDKKYCSSVRENLLKTCPVADEGKACRNEAKQVFNSCYKTSKESDDRQTTATAGKTDSAACMTAFTQQQQACTARRLPPPVPGQRSVPDTCLQDAIAAQNRCLANSR